jgi:hypothetical protein
MQDWHDIINCFCKSAQASAIMSSPTTLIIITPREITEQETVALKNGIPFDINLEIVVSAQPSTILCISEALIYSHLIPTKMDIDKKTHKFILEVKDCQHEINSPIWNMIGELIKIDTYFKAWELILNGESHVFDFSVAKVLSSHKATAILTKDTLTDLQITLENCQDVNDFINQI